MESPLPLGAAPSDPAALLSQRRQCLPAGPGSDPKELTAACQHPLGHGLDQDLDKTRWIAEGITGCTDFGRQTSAGAADSFFAAITFFVPALC